MYICYDIKIGYNVKKPEKDVKKKKKIKIEKKS